MLPNSQRTGALAGMKLGLLASALWALAFALIITMPNFAESIPAAMAEGLDRVVGNGAVTLFFVVAIVSVAFVMIAPPAVLCGLCLGLVLHTRALRTGRLAASTGIWIGFLFGFLGSLIGDRYIHVAFGPGLAGLWAAADILTVTAILVGGITGTVMGYLLTWRLNRDRMPSQATL